MEQHQKQSPHSPKRVAVPVLVKDGKPCSGTGSGANTGSAVLCNAHAQQSPSPEPAAARQPHKGQTRVMPPAKTAPTAPQRPTPVSVSVPGPVQQRTVTTNTPGMASRPPGTVLQHHAGLHNSTLSHQAASCQSAGSASSSRIGQTATDLGAMHAAHLAHSTGYVSHAATIDIMSRSCVFNDRTW